MPDFYKSLLIALLLAALAGFGCTFEPGEPWGYIDAEVKAHSIEDSGDVTISSQTITFGEMELRAPGQSTDAVDDFDPSDPPPGFYLCHQNHCHHEDGNIYTYDEIESGVGVDTEGPVNVARRTLNAEYDLGDQPMHNERFRIVDEVTLNQTALTIDSLTLEGQLDDGDTSYDLEISLGMASRSLSTGIFYDIGAGSQEVQDMKLEIIWPDDLFADLEDKFDDAVDGASDGDTIAVHGTSNTELRAALIDRIIADSEFVWLEDDVN